MLRAFLILCKLRLMFYSVDLILKWLNISQGSRQRFYVTDE